MNTNLRNTQKSAGYSLVEVVVASTVLLIGVGAAAVLSLTVSKQEDAHLRVSRAVNLMENATRLYQLGLPTVESTNPSDPYATVFSLLPPDPIVKTFTASTESNISMPGIGLPLKVDFTMTYWAAGDTDNDNDTDANDVIRTLGPIKSIRNSLQY